MDALGKPFQRTWISIVDVLMSLAVILLPVTSMPLISRLAGGTLVAPPSVVLLAGAALLWFPFYILKKGHLARENIPILVFFILAIISSLLSFFLPLPSYKDVSHVRETLSSLLTLAGGLVTYLIFSSWCQGEQRLKWIFRLINLCGILTLGWSLAQMVVIYFFNGNYPPFMINFHNLLSIRSLATVTFTKRVTGFAYEPSWLAHQLNVFFLPFWLAATITHTSIFKRRFVRLSLENVLLVIGFVIMLLSWSRIGLLSLLAVFLYFAYRLGKLMAGWAKRHIFPSKLVERWPKLRESHLLDIFIVIGLLIVYLLLALAIVYVVSFIDPRVARIFDLKKLPGDFITLARKLAFAERLIYWSAGFNVFTRYPLFGVGLGNSGFFFSQVLPMQGRALDEIIRILTELSFLPNPKNLWVRLLSETGMTGFSLFISWLIVLWSTVKFLLSSRNQLERMVGWMGLITILALIGEGFSIDSFALPYYWVSLGILTAASMSARENANRSRKTMHSSKPIDK